MRFSINIALTENKNHLAESLSLEQPSLSVGKKKGEVDLVLQDASVSRMHARITNEEGDTYLEDLNSTNGTFQNGQRMRPYEKKKPFQSWSRGKTESAYY